MTRDFEYISYDDADRIAILENRAAELERRLSRVLPQEGRQGWGKRGDARWMQVRARGETHRRRHCPGGRRRPVCL